MTEEEEQQQPQINSETIESPPLLEQIVTNLFNNFLEDEHEEQTTHKIISFSHNVLLHLLSQCSISFYKSIEKNRHNRSLTFLANYHKIINIKSIKEQSYITNNMSLHFINLLAYSRMKQNNIDEARNIYKNVWMYVGVNKSTDKLLLAVGLNNLGYLHVRVGKYFKSLECHLKVIEVMGEHLREVKTTMKEKNRSSSSFGNKIIEDSVVLISNLVNCQKTLKFILSENNQVDKNKKRKESSSSSSSLSLRTSFYYELFQYINEIGYKCSKKYLGEKSEFTKVFLNNLSEYNINNKQLLPVFYEHEQEEEEQSVERTTLEQKILSQLEGIYEVLKTKREYEQREIIYVRQEEEEQKENIVQEEEQKYEPVIEESIEPSSITQHAEQKIPEEYEEEMEAGGQFSQIINGWSVMLYFLRAKNHLIESIPTKKQEQEQEYDQQFTLGTLVIECKKNKRLTKTIISTERLQKILTLIITDLEIEELSSEYLEFKRISSDEQFFNHIIFPHIFIENDDNSDGVIEISPRKRSLLSKPFFLKFLEEESLIFLYHRERNNFCIDVSPIKSSSSLSLHVEFNNEYTMNKLFGIKEKYNKCVVDSYELIREQYYKRQQIEMPEIKNCEELFTTQVTLIDENQVIEVIKNIVNDFESFILDIEQEDKGNLKLTDYLSMIENDELNKISYFSFTETYEQTEQNNKINSAIIRGRFTQCKYLQNISSIEIYCQNNYQTYDIESQSKAKGTVMIYPDKFEKEYGLSIKTIEKEGMVMSVLEMLNKRYELRVFYSHLKTHDEELYNQNAIFELPLTCKSYKRAIIKNEDDFMIPITISLLSFNGSVPVAFRIDAYFPCEGCCGQYSILMKVKDCLWVKPEIIEEDEEKEEEVDNNNNNYKEAIENEDDEYETKLVTNNNRNKQSELTNVYKKDYFLAEWCELEGYNMLLKHITIEDMKIKFNNSIFRYFSFERVLESIMKNESQ